MTTDSTGFLLCRRCGGTGHEPHEPIASRTAFGEREAIVRWLRNAPIPSHFATALADEIHRGAHLEGGHNASGPRDRTDSGDFLNEPDW